MARPPITERIEREAGVPRLADILDGLPPTDLQSLLLEVFRRRCARRAPADVLRDYRGNRFVGPGAAPVARLAAWDEVVRGHLPEWVECVPLSPVCPLGTSSVLAGLSQDWAVATTRNTEVVSDPTNVLALECALRRRKSREESVHLASSHRALRPQFVEGPNLFSHFALFGTCSGGRNHGNSRFEVSTTAWLLRFYVRALRAFIGPAPLRVTVSDLGERDERDLIEEQVVATVRELGVACDFDAERTHARGYYSGIAFGVWATDASGEEIRLVDGGAVDWTRRLLSDERERMVISGIGSERVCAVDWHGGFRVRAIEPGDSDWLRAFLAEHWGSEDVVVHGERFHPVELPGFVATVGDARVGLITYDMRGSTCEIVTLNSTVEGRGIGAALIGRVREIARERDCTRLCLTTTNDNLHALRFYQKRGFELVAVHRGAVETSRELKPEIPAIGCHGIALRDEIEMALRP